MIQTIKYKSFQVVVVVLGFLLSPGSILAAPGGPTGAAVQLENPLEVDSIEELLVAILNILIIIAVPLIVFFIIYAGFLYVTARGNATQVEQATRALTYAIIGGVLILGAVALSEIIKNLVASFT